jgi:hypothetical protein
MNNKGAKIVELYGLPGCGKTTIQEYLRNLPIECGGLRYGYMPDVTKPFRKLPFWRQVKYIPFKAVFLFIRFFMTLPLLPLKDWRLYRVFFSFVMIYNYSRKIEAVDYVLIDHGIIQSVVGLLYGRSDTLSDRSKKRLQKALSCSYVGYVVLCDISPETSLKRIRLRGRSGGRLDQIADDKILKHKLEIQSRLFRELYQITAEISETCSIRIDSESAVKSVAKQLTDKLV